jgi:hypothetical protein
MASKRQNAPSEEADSCQVRSNALGAFKRTHDRTQQQGSNARPVSPSHHNSYLRSNMYPGSTTNNWCVRTQVVRSNALQ